MKRPAKDTCPIPVPSWFVPQGFLVGAFQSSETPRNFLKPRNPPDFFFISSVVIISPHCWPQKGCHEILSKSKAHFNCQSCLNRQKGFVRSLKMKPRSFLPIYFLSASTWKVNHLGFSVMLKLNKKFWLGFCPREATCKVLRRGRHQKLSKTLQTPKRHPSFLITIFAICFIVA